MSSEKKLERLQSILTATAHAATLCSQLLAVGGKARSTPEPINVPAVLQGSHELFELTMQSHCRLELNAAEDAGLIRADASQLRQVLVNLILNAKQASERNSVIQVGCFRSDLRGLDRSHDRYLHSWLPEATTDCVCVYVEDSGQGIGAVELERVFEPYFTGRDQGHGLGLAAVHGIVKANCGALRVRSEPGVGSRFECFFPVIDAGRPAQETDVLPPAAAHKISRVLVVDDNSDIVKLTVAMLTRAGIEVEAFTSGAGAVEVLNSRHADFDLVISDINMPDVSGMEILQTVRRLDSKLPVVLASGYSDNQISFEDDAVTWFLQKPWSLADLDHMLAKISESLSQARIKR